MEIVLLILIFLLPMLIPCGLAFIPVSPRLKWVKYIRNILICVIVMVCVMHMLDIESTTSSLSSETDIFAAASCRCVTSSPFVPCLIYFLIFFGLIAFACKISRFKYFNTWISYPITVFMTTIPVCILTNRMCCRGITGELTVLILTELTTISHIIYKKALAKQSKK